MISVKKTVILFFFIQAININIYASNSKLLFNGNCTICHLISKNKTAPSILEIKSRYLRAYPNKKDFVKQMSIWVKNPNEETSIMQEYITKYKIMPNLAYDIGALEEIAAYIYDTNFLTNKN